MIQIRSLFPLLAESSNKTISSKIILLEKSESVGEMYSEIKQKTGADKIFRLSVFLTNKNKLIFSTPTGPDMNTDLSDLEFCAKTGRSIIQKLGIEPKIGIISGGREGDIGRNEVVDKTIEDAKNLQKLLEQEEISATHYTILIEDAIKEADFLILPDSLSGEMILKTVAGIGEGREIGNIWMLKKANGECIENPIYIEQLTKKADPKDLEILKEALEM
jgi:Predicted phosphotransacetylase